MSKKNCNDNKVDIAVIDNRLKATEDYIEELQKNHIPHIYSELSNIKIWIAGASGGLAVLITFLQIFIK